MTTKVCISIDQTNLPVIVEVLDSNGRIRYSTELREIGNSTCEYVHSGQTLRVREMTTEEIHNRSEPAAAEKPAYFCEKCGYSGETSAHDGCNYLAWREAQEWPV